MANPGKNNPPGTYGPPKGRMVRGAQDQSASEKPKSNAYLENAIKTASREQLLLMLLDGARRFAEKGKQAIAAEKREEAHDQLVRAQNIITELICSLKPDIGNEVYSNLVKLYHFCYERLVRANVEQSTEMVDESLRILADLREMWGAAVTRMNEEGRPDALNPSQILTHRLDNRA